VRGDRLHGTVKILVTRGSGPRGYAPPPHPRPTRIVGFMPATPDEAAAWRQGVTVRFCQTALGHSPALAGLKTLGRLEQVLARAEWADPAIAEGLMCDPEGRIVCGTMSNVFAVSKGRLMTPDLKQCGVRGVMRRVVMELAKRLGLEVRETALSGADIRKADELFVTNALIGLWPVSRCEQRSYEIGPVTVALRRALAGAGVEECRA
jgi:4-amino-4-deoxychorismate lyase